MANGAGNAGSDGEKWEDTWILLDFVGLFMIIPPGWPEMDFCFVSLLGKSNIAKYM